MLINTNENDYKKLCNEITMIRDNIITLKDRMILEYNTDELRHLRYSIEEMQITLKEKMTLLNLNKPRYII